MQKKTKRAIGAAILFSMGFSGLVIGISAFSDRQLQWGLLFTGIGVASILGLVVVILLQFLEDTRAKLENYKKFVGKFVQRPDVFKILQGTAMEVEKACRESIQIQQIDADNPDGKAAAIETAARKVRQKQDEHWDWVHLAANICDECMPLPDKDVVVQLRRESFKDYLPDKQA